MSAVYLSPHHDDIAFSLGCLAKKLSGTLVDIFSISSYTHESLGLPHDVETVSRLRNEEDDRFARACGLSKMSLDQLDSPLRGRAPFDGNGRAGEVEDLCRLLKERLSPLSNTAEKMLLFCPAAIGGHRDHLITRDAMLRDFAYFSGVFEIVFYEDLHYASNKEVREKGLADLAEATKQWGYNKRYRFAVTPQKLDFVRLYQSQFDHLPVDLSAFSPADGSQSQHEAVWARADISVLEQASA